MTYKGWYAIKSNQNQNHLLYGKTPQLSRPESNGYEGGLHTPQISETGVSLSHRI